MRKIFPTIILLIIAVFCVQAAETTDSDLYIDVALTATDFQDHTVVHKEFERDVQNIILSTGQGDGPFADDTGITLVKSKNYQAGGAFINKRLDVSSSFAIAFSVNVSNPSGTIADGFMFIVSRDATSIGGTGGQLGYGGIQNSFGLEFDDYKNDEFGDGDFVHTDFRVNGQMYGQSGFRKDLGINYSDFRNKASQSGGCTVYCWIEYDAYNKILEARYAFDTTVRPQNASIRVEKIDMRKLIKDNVCYIGFTGGTGMHYHALLLNCLMFDSGSCEPLDFNSTNKYHSVLLNTCEHKNLITVEPVTAMCNIDGSIGYRYCNDCHRKMDMEGNDLLDFEIIQKASHPWEYSFDGEKINAICTNPNCPDHYNEASRSLEFAFDNASLKFSVVPDNATNKTLKLTALDENVAIVSEKGDVLPRGAGETTIRIETSDESGIYKNVKVSVPEKELPKLKDIFSGSSVMTLKYTYNWCDYELDYVYNYDGTFILKRYCEGGKNQTLDSKIEEKHLCFKYLDNIECHHQNNYGSYAIYINTKDLTINCADLDYDRDARSMIENFDILVDGYSFKDQFTLKEYTQY